MKNKFKWFGIIALIAIMGFAMAGCGWLFEDTPTEQQGTDDPDNPGDPYDLGNPNTWKLGALWEGSAANQIQEIAYGNGKFVAVGVNVGVGNKMTGIMATSTDGKTWTEITGHPFGEGSISAIAYGGGKFVAGGAGGQMAYSTDGANWTAVADSGIWNLAYISAIAYGNGKFVASCGGVFKMAYSTDGVTWTKVTGHPLDGSNGGVPIVAIAYGNGKFVADTQSSYQVFTNGTIEYGVTMTYSADGITWATAERGPGTISGDCDGIAYGNDKFIAVKGYYGYSTDGVTWTFNDIGDTPFKDSREKVGKTEEEMTAIGYGNGTFVAGGRSGQMAYSTDGGITWTRIRQDVLGGGGGRAWASVGGKVVYDYDTSVFPICKIAYGNGTFVATDGHAIAYSAKPKPSNAADNGGMAWTAVDNPSFYTNALDNKIAAIAYGNGKFVAVSLSGQRPMYSTDGITWEQSGSPSSYFTAIAYGNGRFAAGTRYYKYGNYISLFNHGKIMSSTDGVTWPGQAEYSAPFGTGSSGGLVPSTSSIDAIAYGNGTFVAVGRSPDSVANAAYSADGVTWTSSTTRPFPISEHIDYPLSIAYGSGKFVAVGGWQGKMAVSTDGITWTAVTSSPFDMPAITIAYGNNKFVAVDLLGKIGTSTDGVTWALAGSLPVVDYRSIITAIAYGNGKFVAVEGSLSAADTLDDFTHCARGRIWHSPDGVTWTPVTDSAFSPTNRINAIAFGNGTFVAVGNCGRIAYSKD